MVNHLLLPHNAALALHLLGSALEIVRLDGAHVHCGDEERCVREKVVHLLEWALLGLGQDGPEKDGIGEVANLMEDIVLASETSIKWYMLFDLR